MPRTSSASPVAASVQATVSETREVAKGTLLVLFAAADYPAYTPGHYFWVELPDRGHSDDRGLRRHISIVTSPTEPGIVGLATRLRDTAFKRTLSELEVGDEVQVEEPKGSFLLPEDTNVRYAFVAGGIGITVFRSMLRYIADKGLPYDVTLVYSNRDRESTPFLDEIRELEGRIEGLRVVFTMTDDEGWDGESRLIDAAMLRDHLGDLDGYTFLVAGPPGMAKAVEATLQEAGVPEGRLLTDSFSGY